MIFKKIGDVYEIAPPINFGGVNNRSLPEEEMVYIRVQGVTITDKDDLDEKTSLDRNKFEFKKFLEETRKRTYALVSSKVLSVHNYFVETSDGQQEIKTFAELCEVAPPELIQWIISVIMSGEALSAAERKNFLPGADLD
jgi:hypothetical protein